MTFFGEGGALFYLPHVPTQQLAEWQLLLGSLRPRAIPWVLTSNSVVTQSIQEEGFARWTISSSGQGLLGNAIIMKVTHPM